MRFTMVGCGYVGLVSGVCLAEVGHQVICVDVDRNKVEGLQQGIIPIYEPKLTDLILRNKKLEHLDFTTDLSVALKDSECVFIAVGTPPGEDGSADLKHVLSVAEQIGDLITTDILVIVKSTVPVGTCDIVEKVINNKLQARNLDFKIEVGSNPEFLKEGDAINDFMKPDRIVVGCTTEKTRAIFKKIYSPFIMDNPNRLYIIERKSAEMTKYAANSMLATRISFMNELSQLCDKMGADIEQVRLGIGSDPRIGQKFLFAGPGYGGSCFPKDVSALVKTAKSFDVELKVLKAVMDANEGQKNYVANKIVANYGDLKGKKIAIWGLAFKPATDDVRAAPAETIIKVLLDNGAEVYAHDPEAMDNFKSLIPKSSSMNYVDEAYSALEGADGLVLLTEWSEYKRPNWSKVKSLMNNCVVFDFRNQYQIDEMKKLEIEHITIGR